MTAVPATYTVESSSAAREVLRALQSRLDARPEPGSSHHAVYYDTFDWRLHRDGGVLSATPHEGGWMLVWKDAAGAVRHQRATGSLPEFASDLPPGDFRQALTDVVESRRLFAVVDVRLRRRALRITHNANGAAVRIELEQGTAAKPDGAGPRRPMRPRLRLIPVRGHDREHAGALRVVEQELGLHRDESGELSPALLAIGNLPGGYSSKLDLVLDPAMRADAAVKKILGALLQAMRANEQGTREDLDSEFLHDFRVAVRRTRTCLGQVPGVIPDRILTRFRKEFSWLGHITGPTRDLDVYLLKMDDYRAEVPQGVGEELEPLGRFLAEHKLEEQRRLAKALGSGRYRALVDSWQKFLGQALPARSSLPNARRPILDVASERIERRHGRVIKRGRAIDGSSPSSALHKLRIDCKKLRYLLEFFRSLYGPDEPRQMLRLLKRLQDNLGDFNDLAVQQETLERFGRRMLEEKRATVGSLSAMGRLVERLHIRQVKERERFRKCFARFASGAGPDRIRRMLASAAGPRE